VADQSAERLVRWLRLADRLLRPVENGLNLLGGALVFGLMFLGMVQIILRTVFRTPIFGYIDIVEFAMVGFAVLGISYVQRLGGHVRMEIVIGRVHGRMKWLIEMFGTAVAMIIVAVLIPYSYTHFDRAFTFGDSTIDIELPTWPGKLLVPITLAILLARLTVQLVGYWRLYRNPDAEPIAVPVAKTIEEQAEEEISGSADAGAR
jgi:TRAP-type C4-dicarboxylate transport system permease small subunit